MPTGGARRGRRDNGFSATEYAVVGDVDPRVGEHLLDVLAGERIAAYLQPATDLHPITRTSTLPARPTDRLYADRAHLETARGYLAQLAADAAGDDADVATPPTSAAHPGTAATAAAPDTSAHGGWREPTDVDTAWADIIAGFDLSVDPTAPPWPASEEAPRRDGHVEEAGRPGGRAAEPGDRDRGNDELPSLLDGLDTFGADLPDDDEEGYRPPPPPPLPRISSTAVLGLIGIAGGILVLFWPSLLPVSESLAMFLAFGGLLGGFVTLIWRLRPGDEEDDDPDDGARV